MPFFCITIALNGFIFYIYHEIIINISYIPKDNNVEIGLFRSNLSLRYIFSLKPKRNGDCIAYLLLAADLAKQFLQRQRFMKQFKCMLQVFTCSKCKMSMIHQVTDWNLH